MATTKELVASFVDHQIESWISLSGITVNTWDDGVINTVKNIANTPILRDFVLDWIVRVIEGNQMSISAESPEAKAIVAQGFDYEKITKIIGLLLEIWESWKRFAGT